MSDETVKERKDESGAEPDGKTTTEERGVNWEDPSVPVGNAPPLSRWPLVALGIAWLAWIIFLGVMMVSRGNAAA